MIIKEELLKEHTLKNSLKVAAFACTSTKNFDQLMECFLSNDYRLAQRAASAVNHVAMREPSYIKGYIKDLVDQLARKDVHNAVIRNSVRILQNIEIPKIYHGRVLNNCFALIEKHETPAAIKAFSLTTLFNLSKVYPEIKQELKLIIEEQWNKEGAAFKARARQILRKME